MMYMYWLRWTSLSGASLRIAPDPIAALRDAVAYSGKSGWGRNVVIAHGLETLRFWEGGVIASAAYGSQAWSESHKERQRGRRRPGYGAYMYTPYVPGTRSPRSPRRSWYGRGGVMPLVREAYHTGRFIQPRVGSVGLVQHKRIWSTSTLTAGQAGTARLIAVMKRNMSFPAGMRAVRFLVFETAYGRVAVPDDGASVTVYTAVDKGWWGTAVCVDGDEVQARVVHETTAGSCTHRVSFQHPGGDNDYQAWLRYAVQMVKEAHFGLSPSEVLRRLKE